MKKIILLFFSCLFILTGCSRESETREIKSIVLKQENEKSASGSFLLLYGNYKSDEEIKTKYYLYIKGIEGFRLQTIDSDYLEIVETNDIEPCIKGVFNIYGKVYNRYNVPSGADAEYTVYVPVGTIIEEYKVDLTEIVEEGEE